MTTPPDVVAFIRARLAEREDAALSALGVNASATARRHVEGRLPASAYPLPEWRYDAGQVWQRGNDHVGGDTVKVGQTWDREGAHIALNDPLAVLQLCHGIREVLQIAEGTASAAATLADAAPGTADAWRRSGAADASRRIAYRIARAWRDHPDYLPEWEMHL